MSLTGGGDGLFAGLSLKLAVEPYERHGVNQRVQLRSSLKGKDLEALLAEQVDYDSARKLLEYFCGEGDSNEMWFNRSRQNHISRQ